MVYVTSLPHPNAPQIRKTTFLCEPCHRTWSYPLVEDLAKRYAAEASFLEASA